jgi:hypothetical protein
MKTQVTSGTGFPGANIVNHLIQQVHEVHVLMRKTSSTKAITDLAFEKHLRHGLPLTQCQLCFSKFTDDLLCGVCFVTHALTPFVQIPIHHLDLFQVGRSSLVPQKKHQNRDEIQGMPSSGAPFGFFYFMHYF